MRMACTSVAGLALLILATAWRSWPSDRVPAPSRLVHPASGPPPSLIIHPVALATP